MRIDLRERVIVITGASSGIGAATARMCARAGMHVVVAARRLERLEALAREIEGMGRRALAVRCDVREEGQVQELVRRTVEVFGRLDVMFANAGYGLYVPVLETTDQQFQDIFQTNLMGTIYCVRAAVEVMRRAGRGHIVICSSAASEVAPPMYGAYAATKAAQDAIACVLRAELADEGIWVTSVHPVPTETEFFERLWESTGGRRPVVASPGPVRQSPEKVARAIVRALRRPVAEVWPHRATRFGAALATAFPGLTAYFLRRHMRKLRELERPTSCQREAEHGCGPFTTDPACADGQCAGAAPAAGRSVGAGGAAGTGGEHSGGGTDGRT